MKIFKNRGCGQCVLLEETNGIMLIAAVERNEYIVAAGPLDAFGSWTGGSYHKTLDDAKDDYDTKTRR